MGDKEQTLFHNTSMGTDSDLYNPGGFLECWGKMVEKTDPDYGMRLYSILERERILPEDLNGFVFFSVSSNSGSRELGFAKILNSSVEDHSLEIAPIIIAGDIAKVPTIDTHELTNIHFKQLQADARDIPLKDSSVDILFDRMGAFWYELEGINDGATRLNGEILDWELEDAFNTISAVLDEYGRVLKKGGKLLIDYPERDKDNKVATSTGQYIEETFGDTKAFFSRCGWKLDFIGEGEDRLGVLTKQ